MTAEEFARLCKMERDAMLAVFLEPSGPSAVAAHLKAAELNDQQRTHVAKAIDTALKDAFYSLLMALDGAASLAGTQQHYLLTDEDGHVVSEGDGRLEAAAYSAFFPNG